MPIVDEAELRELLAKEQIKSLTLDTSVFDSKGLRLNSAAIKAIVELRERPIKFVLAKTVQAEVILHLENSAKEALRSVKKAIGQALFAFETESPTRDGLLKQISGNQSAREAAEQRWNHFIVESNCEIIQDTDIVDVGDLFARYFSTEPPFGPGRKKSEFPDALALLALERTAADEDAGIIVVSADADWRRFCEASPKLYLVPEIERALALVTDAPLGLRSAVFAWMIEGGDGEAEVYQSVARNVEEIDFLVNAHPTFGQISCYAWNGELQNINWPDKRDVDIIECKICSNKNQISITVSVPIVAVIDVHIELNFSVWDGIDGETIGMGGRSTTSSEEIEFRVFLGLDIKNYDGEKLISLKTSETDLEIWEVDLGEVDVFEPEDEYDTERHK